MAEKINVAFLWHQHQPYYRTRGADGTVLYHLPWVRLHAVKDYYDIPRLLDDFPKLKQNFNLVPSLLVQMEDYVNNRALDRVLELTLKKPRDLSPEDKEEILDLFFLANYAHLIAPYPRYLELWAKKKSGRPFSDQDFLDLQVWYNLCWTGESWKEKDPFRSLFDRAENFSETDKESLVNGHYAIMAEVIPLYRRLAAEKRIELSVTPYYHPILPLLCDTGTGGEKELNFRHPEDARTQMEAALSYFESLFGYRPGGCWPSEGSVSEAAVRIIGESGIEWLATDQEILEYSDADRKNIYLPYRLNDRVCALFRDHAMSDAIGFTYAGMDAESAVSDFMKRIEAVRSALIAESLRPETCLLSIILDGENCWEFYEKNGQNFLRLLYEKLSASETVATTTIGDYLKKTSHIPRPQITRLHAGSWIRHNFDIWIRSHPEKNLAWRHLKDTRDFLEARGSEGAYADAVLKSAWEEIYIAEGSDWFWWFGDDHHAQNKSAFDSLFRHHLIRVYEILNETPPACLRTPIMATPEPDKLFHEPSSWIRPKIDGRVTHYYEWRDAGMYDALADGDTMHRSDAWIEKVYYGFDLVNVYFRIDFAGSTIEQFRSDHVLQLRLEQDEVIALEFTAETFTVRRGPDVHCEFKFGEIFELAVPRGACRIHAGRKLEAVISVLKNGREILRRPSRQPLAMVVTDENFDKYLW